MHLPWQAGLVLEHTSMSAVRRVQHQDPAAMHSCSGAQELRRQPGGNGRTHLHHQPHFRVGVGQHLLLDVFEVLHQPLRVGGGQLRPSSWAKRRACTVRKGGRRRRSGGGGWPTAARGPAEHQIPAIPQLLSNTQPVQGPQPAPGRCSGVAHLLLQRTRPRAQGLCSAANCMPWCAEAAGPAPPARSSPSSSAASTAAAENCRAIVLPPAGCCTIERCGVK